MRQKVITQIKYNFEINRVMNHSHKLKEDLLRDFAQTLDKINSRSSCDIENDLTKIIQKSRFLIYEDQL